MTHLAMQDGEYRIGVGGQRIPQKSETPKIDDSGLPHKNLAMPAFWRASQMSMNCRVTSIYVWPTADGYAFGREKPIDAPTVAVFYKDRMTFSIWGGAQNDDDPLLDEIRRYDDEHKGLD